MTSQLVIFRAFLFIFFRPPNLDLKKISCKSTNKKNLASFCFLLANSNLYGSKNCSLWVFFFFA